MPVDHSGHQSNHQVSTDMQNDLCGKRVVGNFVEWRDTPIQRKPGFATTDGCWVFGELDGKLRSSGEGEQTAGHRVPAHDVLR